MHFLRNKIPEALRNTPRGYNAKRSVSKLFSNSTAGYMVAGFCSEVKTRSCSDVLRPFMEPDGVLLSSQNTHTQAL